MNPLKSTIYNGLIIDGRYRVKRPIGSGGMGTVYQAVHMDLNRPVAIKVLKRKFSDDPEAIARFHQEARIAGGLPSDNICEVTDVGQTLDGQHYFVMPLLSGESLAEIVRAERLPIARSVDIVRQVLSALEITHGAGIIHRDLKPHNIFVTQIGDRTDFVKVLDFGISKVIHRKESDELTSSGMVIGTPHYMAPEQARASKSMDHRVDIYSAGVILYELLTGRRPFSGNSLPDLTVNILSCSFPTPGALNSEVPRGLEEIVLKAMDREPSQRFESAAEMRSQLAVFDVRTSSGRWDAGPRTSTNESSVWPQTAMTESDSLQNISASASVAERTESMGIRSKLMFAAIAAVLIVAGGIGLWMDNGTADIEKTTSPDASSSGTQESAAIEAVRPSPPADESTDDQPGETARSSLAVDRPEDDSDSAERQNSAPVELHVEKQSVRKKKKKSGQAWRSVQSPARGSKKAPATPRTISGRGGAEIVQSYD